MNKNESKIMNANFPLIVPFNSVYFFLRFELLEVSFVTSISLIQEKYNQKKHMQNTTKLDIKLNQKLQAKTPF